MSKRTYEVAEAIMDQAISEFRFVNLKSIESVDEYAFNGMNIGLSFEESWAILAACRAYMAFLDSLDLPALHGSDDWAIDQWREIVRKPLEKFNGRNLPQTFDRIKAAFCIFVKSPSDRSLNWIFTR